MASEYTSDALAKSERLNEIGSTFNPLRVIMTEIVACPSCQRKLQIPENFLGQMVQCPDCNHQFQANPPTSSVQATPPSSSPSARDKPGAANSYDDDREDDRPRRRRFEDDDDDDDLRISRRRQYQAPHRAGLVLVMGILSICCVAPIITGTIAWILGNSDLREMDAGRMDPSGRGQTQTGKTLGMVGVIINIVIIVGYCLLMIFFGALGGRQGRRF